MVLLVTECASFTTQVFVAALEGLAKSFVLSASFDASGFPQVVCANLHTPLSLLLLGKWHKKAVQAFLTHKVLSPGVPSVSSQLRASLYRQQTLSASLTMDHNKGISIYTEENQDGKIQLEDTER